MTSAVRAIAAATASLLLIAVVLTDSSSAQERRPNILLIVSDDLGYGGIGVYSSRDIPTRVAFAIAWKGHLESGRVDDRPIIQLDVLPTALAAAGVAVDASEFDGVSLLPFLAGKTSEAPHDALYWRLGGMMAIRRGDWKLVKTRKGRFIDVDPSVLSDRSEAGLYNLADDIGETRDQSADRPDKVRELSELCQQWHRQLSTPLWSPPGRSQR